MLTSDVEKYIETQFTNKLTPEEVVEDLVKGGWREADAKTVVRQYETKNALEHTPPEPPADQAPQGKEKVSTTPAEADSRKKTQKINFSQVGSHGDHPEVEVGEDFVPEKETEEPPKIHQETEEKPISVEEQKNASQNEKRAKAEELLSSKVDMNASYEDLAMKMPEGVDRKEIYRNQSGKSDSYKEPVTTFNPLDVKPHRDKKEKKAHKSHARSSKNSQESSRKKRVLGMLVLIWLLVIGVVIFLYFTFVQSGQKNQQNSGLPIVGDRPVVERITDQKEPIGVPVTSTCESDINCFVLEGSKCLTPVSVEKVTVNSFFATRQKVRAFLSVTPQEEGDCLFASQILSVNTEFTGDVAESTRRNVQAEDEKSVGLEGLCVISSNEIGGFLEKVRDGSLSDLDVLSLECSGTYFEQDSLKF